MANMTAAQQLILDAAVNVFSAVGLVNPNNSIDSRKLTLNINDRTFSITANASSFVQAVIEVMGYNPNWGVSSVANHQGPGWYLTDATAAFVKNVNGLVSEDWILVDYSTDTPQIGDICSSSVRSELLIYLGEYANRPRALSANTEQNLKASVQVANEYKRTGELDLTKAPSGISEQLLGRGLRYVRGSSEVAYSVPGNTRQVQQSRSVTSLDITLEITKPATITFSIRGPHSTGVTAYSDFQLVEPGFFKPEQCYRVENQHAKSLTNLISDWEQLDIYIGWLDIVNYPGEHKQPCIIYTIDGSDPEHFGKTVYQKEEGGVLVNDYERSAGLPIILSGWRLPLQIRMQIIDAADISRVYAQGSGLFTFKSDNVIGYNPLLNQYWQALLLDKDTDNMPIGTEDQHGYLYPNPDLYNLYTEEVDIK